MLFNDATIREAIEAWLVNSTNATAIYGPIRDWNTYYARDMAFLFYSKQSFNEDLSGWDTSQVSVMNSMFYNASSFNGDVSSWNTSNVRDMKEMFSGSSFNSDVSSWNTAKVTVMEAMFFRARPFNRDITSWNISRVSNMARMFYEASSFNIDLSLWDTSRVTDMSQMFYTASSFNQTLCWNTSRAAKIMTFDGSRGSFASSPYPFCLPAKPTTKPTGPSAQPSGMPTDKPNTNPTALPSLSHTAWPSYKSTSKPSARPTTRPTARPTIWSGPWTSQISPLYGTISSNLTLGHGSCPKGSKIVSIKAWTSDWIYQLSATCDDKRSTSLGPWGTSQNILDVKTQSCPEGYQAWQITYGSVIGRMIVACGSSSQSCGRGFSLGSGSTDGLTLLGNQSIVGFQVYSDSLGIHAIRIESVEFPPTGRCYNAIGEPTGRCPTKAEYLAILWGVLTVMGAFAIVFTIVRNRRNKRHKKSYRKNDDILPLK